MCRIPTPRGFVNTIVIVHPLRRGTVEIGNYDVIALRLIERIKQLNEANAA